MHRIVPRCVRAQPHPRGGTAGPDPDLARLAQRWAEQAGDDAPLDAGSLAGLAHLRENGAPREARRAGERPTLPLHLLPVALLAFENPRTVTALTWHLAALTHPDPESTWGAVAINVAASRLLQGHRDFVPDVIEALRNNEAPVLLLETVRRLPLLRRENINAVAGSDSPAIGATCAALWAAHTEPRRPRRLHGWRSFRRRSRPRPRQVPACSGRVTASRRCALPSARDRWTSMP